jgi:ABC-type glycerol-3-phosphate transport system substrate-binding protein
MRLKIGVIAALAAALVAAGCGGSAGGHKAGATGAAAIAPDSATAYVAVDSNLDSAA